MRDEIRMCQDIIADVVRFRWLEFIEIVLIQSPQDSSFRVRIVLGWSKGSIVDTHTLNVRTIAGDDETIGSPPEMWIRRRSKTGFQFREQHCLVS